MLYGETNVDIEQLKQWSSSLSLEQCLYNTDKPTYKILKTQLNAFKSLVSRLKPDDDWRKVLSVISPYFQECFFKTPRGAIKIANYYECFLEPANIETKKKMIQGYADIENTGEVELFEQERKIGSIGVKSDLIWDVFYDYFVIESEDGIISYTLFNSEEVLSLQLYNVAGKDEQSIDDYINNILLKLSIEKGFNFKRINPCEQWRSKGHTNIYEIQVDNCNYESTPLAYMNYGLTCDNPRMAFLHFYQVLEYFFIRAQNANLMSILTENEIFSSTSFDDNSLHKTLKKYIESLKEVESLKLVLQEVVDVEKLKQYIRDDEKRLEQYTGDSIISKNIQINLNANNTKIINKLAERIYFFRCAIAHAKGDVDKYLAMPDKADLTIQNELPLLRDIAYEALKK